MRLEYIRLKRPELIYGRKEMLEYELSFLLVVKKFEELRKLITMRELLKKELRTKIGQAHKSLLSLEEELPSIHEEQPLIPKKKSKHPEVPTLEQEIAEVKAKIAVLQDAEQDEED
jgi:hypothetical protein